MFQRSFLDSALDSEVGYISQLLFGNILLCQITISLESDSTSKQHELFGQFSGTDPSLVTETSRETELR